ncbi:sigma-E processing peptidase SpoIIGA [uncultured Dysosmobacter sp.]|uniref:sigma-E processing peptidase SpoIIGA n=1 Tax=uncultured Dysosmobacter sp. TaxID=2591384 RepID=UPI00261B2A24|nr:sigma-E processing peptidase SpoIIGA [uncultured Dysosmobacter sp.]
MTVVYIDSVFVLNTVMDYLLLLAAARLAGRPLRRRRYLLAALAGGVYAVAAFLPGCGFLTHPAVKLAAGVLMALLAYGGEERLLRLTLLLLAVSCAMAGCVLALGLLAGGGVPVVNGVFYTNVDAKVLLIAATSAYLVLTVVFRAAMRQGISGQLLPVRIRIGGRCAELTALWDSGCGLRDPVGGQPVLVLAPGALDGILSVELRHLLTPERLRCPAELLEPLRSAAPELRPRLLTYQAVGTGGGLLLTLRTEWTEIAGTAYPGLAAALSPTALGDGYAALWGGERRKRYADFSNGPAMAAGPLAASGGRPLHRRQRYPAAASDPGAGGGAAGAAGRRERP